MRRLLALSVLASGCIPSFDQVDCYSELDCPAASMCVNGACVAAPDLDAGLPDALARDAEPDAGAPDAELDAGAPDGAEDAGQLDAAPLGDSGTTDAGYFLQVSPTAIDFGSRPVDCTGPDETAMLTNLGVMTVSVTGLALAGGSSPAFTIVPLATPFTLIPGASRGVDLAFLPDTPGVHNGRLLVSYQPDPVPKTVDLTGMAVAGPTVTDTLTQRAGPIDILFVLDDNNAMLQLEQRLATHLPAMLSRLDLEGWDYQIGVTNADVSAQGDQGALEGTPPFVTRDNVTDPQADLEARVLVGEAGFPADDGLEASRLALSAPLITLGVNAGFLRANAALLVIYLAKQPDTSPMTVSTYSSFLQSLKSNPAIAMANVIVPQLSSCPLDDGTTAFYGGRQLGMAQNTGGAASDACTADWTLAMSTLPPVPHGTTFALSLTPRDPATIEVTVGGTAVPSAGGANWTYDSGQNAVIFSAGHEPQLGERIEITYASGC